MKANEFVEKFGWGKAKAILENRRSWTDKKSGRKLTGNSFVLQSKTYEHAIGTLYMGNFSDYDENSYRGGEVNLLHLKRLVESWELVGRIGTIHEAKNLLNQLMVNKIEFVTIGFSVNGRPVEFRKTQSDLKQAIADVESCQ